MNIPKAKAYIETRVLVAPMDYPGQLHIWCGIICHIKNGNSSGILEQILHVVPMIGSLHVLAQKPKSYKINLILKIVSQGWSQVRSIIV
ncbi:1845_t:CDS:2 [Dentiscutata erythropus]|uniref:1845_t:CDS:1 n=1 Tax=Dentiscutata erythropus TaxID=1348616 RepID=A0A9N9H4U9_9GLOM|nr:1845_t:CDS:2 [Dentiscutata erythropus]